MKAFLPLTILLLSASMTFGAAAQAEDVKPTVDTISEDYKTAYYWAFYGSYSRDSKAYGEVLSRMSDLTARIYEISKEEAYGKFKSDVAAQGGPQLLLADVAIKRVALGLQLGFHNEVRALINSAHQVNPQFGASLAMMSMGMKGQGFDGNIRDLARPPRATDVQDCMRSCAVYFLGLQNNQLAMGRMNGHSKDHRRLQGPALEQINRRFPNEENAERPRFRKGLNPAVAMTDQCMATCFNESVSAAATAFTTVGFGATQAGATPQVALAAGMAAAAIAGPMKGLECSTSATCAKDKTQENNEREASRLKAENDLRAEKQRKIDLDRRDKEQQEQAKKDAEAKKIADEKRRAEEAKNDKKEMEKRDLERKIKDSFDRNKNKDAKTDSSASCESTKSCTGTANVLTIPEEYREPKESNIMVDGEGNILSKRDLTSTPGIKKDDTDSAQPMTDGEGRILTKRDLTSTPGTKKQATPIMTDGYGKVLKKIDLTSTPGPRREIFDNPEKFNKDLGTVIRTIR